MAVVVASHVSSALFVVDDADDFFEGLPPFFDLTGFGFRWSGIGHGKMKNLMRLHARWDWTLRLEDTLVVDDGDGCSWGLHEENCTPVRRTALVEALLLVLVLLVVLVRRIS
jgi:hypothetical protein